MTFFPLPGTYGVVEIDVEKTLQGLDDPSASAAAAGIKTTKCIVYLDAVLNLPFPSNTTFKYAAQLVGPGLRPENPDLDLAPDMCAPIYPNTYHPSGDRQPLMPCRPFPLNNCNHWFGTDMEKDFRVWNEGRRYPEEERLSLPAEEQVRMEYLRADDLTREAAVHGGDDAASVDGMAPHAQASLENYLPAGSQRGSSDLLPSLTSGERAAASLAASPLNDCGPVQGWECGLAPSGRSSPCSDDGIQTDVFGLDYNERDELLPIVKMWPDVGGHFTEADVPSPVEFIKQYDEVVRILKDSKARVKALQASKRSEASSQCAAGCEGCSFSESAYSGKRRRAHGIWAWLANVSRSVLCLR